MDNKETPITYQEFLRLHASFAPPPTMQQLDEAAGGEEIFEIEKKKDEPNQQNETTQQQQQHPDEQISSAILMDLCRVCGNKGNISLYTEPPEKLLCFKPTRESRVNSVLIAQMIEDLSGEKIHKGDLLPQYVCNHCMSYLQHAYNVRCQILETTNNFKLVQKLQAEEGTIPLQLSPSRTFPTISENQKEIIEEKAEIEGEKYWNDVITRKTTKITIAVSREKKNERLTEHKCNSCGKRVYSIKSLNNHMDLCIIAQLTTFFSQLQLLYQAFLAHKISSLNYQMQSLSLIYNTNKILRKISKKAKLELSSLSPEVSVNDVRTLSLTSDVGQRRQANRFYSPDFGYNSGNP